MTGGRHENTYDIDVVETVPGAVLELHRSVRAGRIGEDIGAGLADLYARAAKAGLHVTGPPSVTYRGERARGAFVDVELDVPVAAGTGHADVGAGARVTGRRALPVARTVHLGAYDRLGAAYTALEKWLRRHDFRAGGPPTETYLVGPDAIADPAGYRTEIAIPVVPALGPTVRVGADFATTVHRTRDALTANGFGVLTETDVRTTLRDRIGAELEDYLILGVCVPELAKQALDIDRQIGLLLPCTVVVRRDGAGTAVTALDPAIMVRATGHAELEPIAAEVRSRLDGALDALMASASPDPSTGPGREPIRR